jgi:L-iditol 2-dehydrogenase
MCAERVSAGYMIDGAFAEYLCIRPQVCHLLPDHVSFKAAAMGEPLAVAIHSVIERSRVNAGDLALISGPGCVGLLTMMIVQLEGGRVIITGLEKDQRRLSTATGLGADYVVDVSHSSLAGLVSVESDGEGVDIAFECAGSQESLQSCFEAVKKGGTVVQVGVYPGPIESDLNQVMMKELEFIGTYGYVWESWQRAVKLLAQSRLNLEPLVTHEFPLREFEEAFQATQDGSATKVIFNMALD